MNIGKAKSPLSRRAVRVLRAARGHVKADGERLAAAGFLDEADRELLRPWLRRWSVRHTAARLSPVRYTMIPVLLVVGATVLVGPGLVVAVTGARYLDEMDRLFASAVYLAIFAAVSATVFRIAGNAMLARLGWLASASCAAAALILAVWTPSPWRGLEYGLIAGVICLLAVPAGARSVGLFYTHLWDPLRRRPLGVLPPSAVAAIRLWFLLDAIQGVGGRWRQTGTRREALGWIWYTVFSLGTTMRLAMWMAGYRGAAYEYATQNYRRAASYVRSLAGRVFDVRDQATFDGIRKELAEVTLALARGNWDALPPMPQRTRVSRLVMLGRRLIAPVALTTVAFALPFIPGVRLGGPAVTSLQVALFVTAALTLTSVDSSAKDRILGAIDEGTRP